MKTLLRATFAASILISASAASAASARLLWPLTKLLASFQGSQVLVFRP